MLSQKYNIFLLHRIAIKKICCYADFDVEKNHKAQSIFKIQWVKHSRLLAKPSSESDSFFCTENAPSKGTSSRPSSRQSVFDISLSTR